jgi:carbon storage regulator
VLCLSRKEDQDILIGEDVIVRIIKLKGNQVRVGIIAPDSVRVLRAEVATQAELARPRISRKAAAELVEDEAEALAYDQEREAEWQRWAETDLATA